jgi:hypothetical protein
MHNILLHVNVRTVTSETYSPVGPGGWCRNWLLCHSLAVTARACAQGRNALIGTKARTSQLILHADATRMTDTAD